MGKIGFRRFLGAALMLLTTTTLAGCTEEPKLVPPPQPDKVQELRGDQATDAPAADASGEEPAE